MKLTRSTVASPLGDLTLVADDDQHLHALQFTANGARMRRALDAYGGSVDLFDSTPPTHIAAALDRYFAGDLEAIDQIPVAPVGDDLQSAVWAALRRIPPGRTTSYGDLARTLGYTDPRAAIDIGAANGANPIAIVIPCHRVIGRSGQLKGYAWGLHRKRWLLEHEKALPSSVKAQASPAVRLPGF